MKHGIEIFIGPKHTDWVFIEAVSREHALALQSHSQDVVPTRLSICTEEGVVLAVHATD